MQRADTKQIIYYMVHQLGISAMRKKKKGGGGGGGGGGKEGKNTTKEGENAILNKA